MRSILGRLLVVNPASDGLEVGGSLAHDAKRCEQACKRLERSAVRIRFVPYPSKVRRFMREVEDPFRLNRKHG
jgi:hypothetical protein